MATLALRRIRLAHDGPSGWAEATGNSLRKPLPQNPPFQAVQPSPGIAAIRASKWRWRRWRCGEFDWLTTVPPAGRRRQGIVYENRSRKTRLFRLFSLRRELLRSGRQSGDGDVGAAENSIGSRRSLRLGGGDRE